MAERRRTFGINLIHPIGLHLDAPANSVDLMLSEKLDRMKEAGADFVELAPHRLGAIVGGELESRRTRTLARLMADSGLDCTVHASDRLNLMEVERHALQRRICENTLRFAAEVGAGVVVYHAGQRHAVRDVRHSLRYQLALERRALWDMGDIAAELGVTIAVENSYPEPLILTGAMYAYGAWLAELADQIYAVDHPAVRACLDVGHAHLAAGYFGYDYLRECQVLTHAVHHLHVHDNLGAADVRAEPEHAERWTQGVGDLHWPPGMGTAPIAETLALPSLARVQTVCLELSDETYHTARQALRTLRDQYNETGVKV